MHPYGQELLKRSLAEGVSEALKKSLFKRGLEVKNRFQMKENLMLIYKGFSIFFSGLLLTLDRIQ